MITIRYLGITGINAASQKLYAFPADANIANWGTLAVPLIEGTGANIGMYFGDVDDSVYSLWYIYYTTGTPQASTWIASASKQLSSVNVISYFPETVNREKENNISILYMENTNIFISTSDLDENYDITNKTLSFIIRNKNKTSLVTIPNNSITKTSEGVSVPIGTNVTSNIGTYLWSLRDITTGDTVLYHGTMDISYAPEI